MKGRRYIPIRYLKCLRLMITAAFGLLALSIMMSVGYLLCFDISIFSNIRKAISASNRITPDSYPSDQFVRVFCNAKNRNLYWDVIRSELPKHINKHTIGEWHFYGGISLLLAKIHFSNKEIVKYYSNTARISKNLSVKEYAAANFHHGFDSMSCDESADIEAKTYTFNSNHQDLRRIQTKMDLCRNLNKKIGE